MVKLEVRQLSWQRGQRQVNAVGDGGLAWKRKLQAG